MRLKRLKIKTRHFHKQRENKLKNYYKHEKIHHAQRYDFFLKKTAKRRGNFKTFSYLCENIINQ